jgi:hypothetical protein
MKERCPLCDERIDADKMTEHIRRDHEKTRQEAERIRKIARPA